MSNSKDAGRRSFDFNSTRQVKRRRNHILVIGINEYKELNRLYYPVRECKDLVKTLIQHYDFEPEPRRVLYDEKATSAEIYTELYNLDDLTENDNLILIFSGHGFYDKTKDVGYWAPVDGKKLEKEGERITNPSVLREYISISHLVDNLKTVKAHHIILIVDSCFSGAFTRIKLQTPDADYNQENMPAEELPSRWVLTSGLIEKVPDKSLFAQALQTALQNHPKEKLTINFLFAQIEAEIEETKPYSPGLYPIVADTRRGGKFAFYRRQEPFAFVSEINRAVLTEGSLEYLARLETGRFKILLISDLLLPHLKDKWLDTSFRKETEKEALPLQKAIEELWQRGQPHAILLGSGGTGKTVSFIRWWREWRKKQEGPIPLFIALNEYNAYPEEEREQFIFRYVNRNYLSGQSFSEAVSDKLWALFAGNSDNTPGFIFLLDGFNEVTVDKAPLLKEMQEIIARAQGLQLLVASRQDINIESFNWARQLNRIAFRPIQPSRIRKYLKSAGVSEMPEKSSFLKLLGNPMMLTIYAGTSEWARKQEKRIQCFFPVHTQSHFQRRITLEFCRSPTG